VVRYFLTKNSAIMLFVWFATTKRHEETTYKAGQFALGVTQPVESCEVPVSVRHNGQNVSNNPIC